MEVEENSGFIAPSRPRDDRAVFRARRVRVSREGNGGRSRPLDSRRIQRSRKFPGVTLPKKDSITGGQRGSESAREGAPRKRLTSVV